MAPFDLNCPKEQLQWYQLDEKTWGVRGCGRQVRYVKICRVNMYGFEECQWVMD